MTDQGIGAQDNDRIEMHNEAGTFTATAGWVWAECLREAAYMRREAFAKVDLDSPETYLWDNGNVALFHREEGAWPMEHIDGIPSW